MKIKALILAMIFISLSSLLFAVGADQSSFEISAYKNRTYQTEGVLSVRVVEWVTKTNKTVSGIGTASYRIPENRIGDPELDFFSIYLKSNLKNRVTVTVTSTDFVNPGSDVKIKTGFTRWTRPEKVFNSGVVQEDYNYYIYEYTTTYQEINANTFTFYNRYRKVPCDSQGIIEGDFPDEYEVFGGYSGLEVVPGIATGYTPGEFEVVYRCPISPEDYARLPEGVEFVSTVTISIGVE